MINSVQYKKDNPDSFIPLRHLLRKVENVEKPRLAQIWNFVRKPSLYSLALYSALYSTFPRAFLKWWSGKSHRLLLPISGITWKPERRLFLSLTFSESPMCYNVLRKPEELHVQYYFSFAAYIMYNINWTSNHLLYHLQFFVHKWQ